MSQRESEASLASHRRVRSVENAPQQGAIHLCDGAVPRRAKTQARVSGTSIPPVTVRCRIRLSLMRGLDSSILHRIHRRPSGATANASVLRRQHPFAHCVGDLSSGRPQPRDRYVLRAQVASCGSGEPSAAVVQLHTSCGATAAFAWRHRCPAVASRRPPDVRAGREARRGRACEVRRSFAGMQIGAL